MTYFRKREKTLQPFIMLSMIALLAALFAVSPVQVTPMSFAEAREPQAAIDRDHRIYIAYGMGDALYLSASQDEGATFQAPIKVAQAGKLALGMRRGPRIAAYDGILTITATYARLGGGRDGDLVAFRSPDRGLTWTGPVRVNDVEGSAREGLHAMAVGPSGELACSWLDLRSKGTKLYVATSKDGGASWSKNRLAYASPSGSICECCHPSLAFDGKSKLFVMFRNSVSGARDMYLATSGDGGRTFSPASKLGEGTWRLDACPMDGGALDIAPNGDVKTFWRREGTLYACSPGAPERMIAEGKQGWVAASDKGDFLAWTEGRRILASTPSERVIELSEQGNDAVLAASPDRKLILAAWAEAGIKSAVLRR